MRPVPLNMFPVFLLLTVPRRYGAPFVDHNFILYFMFIFVMLSSDLNVKKSGPGITMSPQNKGRLKLSIEIFNTLY